MAQFDIHRNVGRSHKGTPYFLIVQSRRYDSLGRRVVVPLRRDNTPALLEPRLQPPLSVEGVRVYLDPLLIFSIDAGALGPFVGSAADQAGDITWALDMLFTQAHG